MNKPFLDLSWEIPSLSAEICWTCYWPRTWKILQKSNAKPANHFQFFLLLFERSCSIAHVTRRVPNQRGCTHSWWLSLKQSHCQEMGAWHLKRAKSVVCDPDRRSRYTPQTIPSAAFICTHRKLSRLTIWLVAWRRINGFSDERHTFRSALCLTILTVSSPKGEHFQDTFSQLYFYRLVYQLGHNACRQ